MQSPRSCRFSILYALTGIPPTTLKEQVRIRVEPKTPSLFNFSNCTKKASAQPFEPLGTRNWIDDLVANARKYATIIILDYEDSFDLAKEIIERD